MKISAMNVEALARLKGYDLAGLTQALQKRYGRQDYQTLEDHVFVRQLVALPVGPGVEDMTQAEQRIFRKLAKSLDGLSKNRTPRRDSL